MQGQPFDMWFPENPISLDFGKKEDMKLNFELITYTQ